MLAWVPNAVAIITMLGVSGKTLVNIPVADPAPVSAASILTFAAALAVSVVAWCPITPDYGIFHDHKTSRYVVFVSRPCHFLMCPQHEDLHLCLPWLPAVQRASRIGTPSGGVTVSPFFGI